MEQTYGDRRIAVLSLRELTREGGEELLQRRLSLEVDKTDWAPQQKDDVKQLADDVIKTFHAGDIRDDKTYATHVLRVACRILSTKHFNVRDDPELIMAALLHDVVEDHPERLLGLDHEPQSLEEEQWMRDQALEVIKGRYSDRVAEMVHAATNPLYDKTGMSEDERQETYRGHVRELMRSDSDTRVIKLSDFIDNCLGLEYNPDPSRRFRLARKYKPVILDMREFVRGSNLSMPVQADIQDDLFHAEILCQKVIIEEGSTLARLGSLATSQSTPKKVE